MPLRPQAVDEARPVEVVALLLAAAAVGDEEGARALERDEVGEAEPRDAHEPVVEDASSPQRERAAAVTEWSTKSSGVLAAASRSVASVRVRSARLLSSS